MGMGQADRSGLCNVTGLSSVHTFNRRYERRHHHNRQNGGKDRHSYTVASLVVVHNKPSLAKEQRRMAGLVPYPRGAIGR
jgi:hypothetical protein